MTKILIVEDNADIRRLIRITLEFDDCVLLESDNAAEGLERACAERPDVMLVDVMMPGKMDGLALCRRVRAEPALAHTRIVMLSARGAAADIERGKEAGADTYLVKPFSPLQLIQVVASFGRWNAEHAAG